MNRSQWPNALELVLAGGGHAHVAVLRKLGMKPVPGLSATLVCPEMHTPYSGMLPGLIAGHYSADEMHIDLRRLARFAGAQIVQAAVIGIDAQSRQIMLAERPPLRYDLLSLNTGSTPVLDDVPGAADHVIPVKPVSTLLSALDRLSGAWAHRDTPPRLTVVGGGAGGVELTLALAHRFRDTGNPPRLSLVTRSDTVLPDHPRAVRAHFDAALEQRAIEVRTGQAVVRVEDDAVMLEDGSRQAADAVIWATHASAPDWLRSSGLALDRGGFVRVNAALQSLSHPQVFAAGDVAALPDPRPKSGVFAVRQSPVLATNLRRQAEGRPLRAFHAQRQALALISTGDRYAVASRGRITLAGAWLWRLKDWIDRRFMARFNDLPQMSERTAAPEPDAGTLPRRLQAPDMRCGGCGAKVGHRALARALARLDGGADAGAAQRDDAAVFTPPAGQQLVQSLDYLRDFLGDPYLLGEIAAEHALNDLYAMGAAPHSALALASVPLAAEAVMEDQLYQLLAGAADALTAAGASLLGGHSAEAAELGIGLAVNGVLDASDAWCKTRIKADMALVLTKPLGTGILFAADMRHAARGEWIANAIASMRQSAAAAVGCLQAHDAVACTDVTGFGLVGHLQTLLEPNALGATLELAALPVLDGATELAATGLLSSLHADNQRLQRLVVTDAAAARHPAWPLLFDPQTAGGLLAAVPAARANACVEALRQADYPQAACIGHVLAPSAGSPPIVVTAGMRQEYAP